MNFIVSKFDFLSTIFPKAKHSNNIAQMPESEIHERIKKISDINRNTSNVYSYTFINDIKFDKWYISTNLSLADLKAMKIACKNLELIQDLKLNENIELINLQIPFYSRLNSLSSPILDLVKLCDLQFVGKVIPLNKSIIRYCLISDEELISLDIHEIAANNNSPISTLIWNRLELIQQHRPELLDMSKETRFNFITAPPEGMPSIKASIGKIRTLNSDELSAIGDKLPLIACNLLSDEQFKSLDYVRFSPDQIDSMLQGPQNQQVLENRVLHLLSKGGMNFLILINSPLLRKLPLEAYASMPFSKLASEQIHEMFPILDCDDPSAKTRFSFLSTHEICKALEMQLLEQAHLKLFSDAQIISAFETRLFDIDQIRSLFPPYKTSLQENLRKVKLLSPQSINCNLDILPPEFMHYLSDDQIKNLDMSRLKDKQSKQLFPTCDKLKLFPGFTYSLETDIQNKPLHCYAQNRPTGSTSNNFSEEELQEMIMNNMNRSKHNLGLLSKDQYDAIKDKLEPEVKYLY